MPPKKNRMSRALFKEISKRAVLRAPLLDVSYVPHPEGLRVACIISKKRVKLAVERNKIRRKIYQAFTATGFAKPYILIIYPQAAALRAPLPDIELQLSQILGTLH